MPPTLGYHLVKSTYGMWLPGDDRGHWSSAWDEQIGYIEPHTMHPADPVRKRMASERMKQPALRMTTAMMAVVAETLQTMVEQSQGQFVVAACAIEATHVHLLLGYTGRDIDATAKWFAHRTTKAVHQKSSHAGAVWAKGRWRSYIFEKEQWTNTARYIEDHNVRAGRGEQPYPFVDQRYAN